MIKKIIYSMFLFCLFIAIPLAMLGIHHVEIGPTFIAFLKQTSLDLAKWKINIPDIPKIPTVPKAFDSSGWEIFQGILNAIIGFFNFIVGLINAIVNMVEFVLVYTQYIFTLVKNLIAFKDTLARIGSVV